MDRNNSNSCFSFTFFYSKAFVLNILILHNTETQVWIGANDIATEGTLVWDNGTTSDNISAGAKWPDGTVKWNTGEPNNAGRSGENCAVIRDSSGVWNDLGCNSSKYGIFEFD